MRRWFLPNSPDLLGLLGRQGEATVRGMDSLVAWSTGDRSQVEKIRAANQEGRQAGKEVLAAVKNAFVTPIGPEDIYEISERLDAVLNGAKNLVREAELLRADPDGPMGEMAALLSLGVKDLVRAFPELGTSPDRATEAADTRGEPPTITRAGLPRGDVGTPRGRRPARGVGEARLYRRYVRIGDRIDGVAHRVWYAVIKQE